jgi:hypothetical protein
MFSTDVLYLQFKAFLMRNLKCLVLYPDYIFFGFHLTDGVVHYAP